MQNDRRTEILITPFQTTKDNTALISVVLHDAVGVVGSLVRALSRRNVNVEVQESSSIDHLDLHRVGMIVDLGNSPNEDDTPERVQHEYRAYAPNVPIHSRRYLELFDAIVAHCGHALWWHPYEERLQKHLIPALYVRPLHRRDELNPSSVVLEEYPDKRFTEIKLPEDVSKHIQLRVQGGSSADVPLSYVFVSDTNDRTLRTFFLPKEFAERLVHVGLYHPDEPGTLARVLNVTASAEFNIVTSLLRKHSEGSSVWEAVLQYKGVDGLPPLKPSDAEGLRRWCPETLVPWVRKKLRASPHFRELDGCDVSIGPPRYPPRFGGAKPENLLRLSRGGERTPEPPYDGNSIVMDLLKQRHTDLENADRRGDEHEKAMGLITTVARHRARIRQRTLFLSYPKTAQEMIYAYLRSELEIPEKPSYHLTELQKDTPAVKRALSASNAEERSVDLTEPPEPEPDDIEAKAIARILEGDYFLAIWHPEKDKSVEASRPAHISPWMFFEYGVARALKKPCVVACHEDLEKTLDPSRLMGLKNFISYNDLNFATRKVSEIRDACTKVFDDDREALF